MINQSSESINFQVKRLKMFDGLRFLNVRIFAFPCLNISLNKIYLGFAFSRKNITLLDKWQFY